VPTPASETGKGRAHHIQGWGASPEIAHDDLQRKAHVVWGGVFQQVDPAGTVEQLAVAWLLDLHRNRQWDEADPQPGKIKPQTIDRYEGTLHSTIKPLLWSVKITSLTPARIYNFLHEVARAKSNHEALMARSVLAGMFDLAILHGVVAPGASPVPSVKVLAIHRPASKLIALSDDDLAVIIQLVLAWEQNRGSKTGRRPDVRLLADLLILTNRLTIRLSEALALRREDVVLDVTAFAAVRAPRPPARGRRVGTTTASAAASSSPSGARTSCSARTSRASLPSTSGSTAR